MALLIVAPFLLCVSVNIVAMNELKEKFERCVAYTEETLKLCPIELQASISSVTDFNIKILAGFCLKFVDVYNKHELELATPEIEEAIKNIANYSAKEQVIRDLSNTNDRRFVLIKAAEELNELAVELLQAVTKPDQFDRTAIIKEIADVKIQFLALEALLDCEEEVRNQIPIKIDKLLSYKDSIKNFGQI